MDYYFHLRERLAYVHKLARQVIEDAGVKQLHERPPGQSIHVSVQLTSPMLDGKSQNIFVQPTAPSLTLLVSVSRINVRFGLAVSSADQP